MRERQNQVIVVGSGVAGAMAAIAATESGAGVTLITRSPAFRSRSACESGGISANEEAFANLVNYFDRIGVPFDRAPDGLIDFSHLAEAGSNTGHAVMMALDGQLRRLAISQKIQLIEGHEFLSPVLDDDDVCRGAVSMDLKNMEIKAHAADALIICTGGYAGLFGRNSTARNDLGCAVGACIANGAKAEKMAALSVKMVVRNDTPQLLVAQTLGGLKIDSKHQTSIEGLFAAGAAAANLADGHASEGSELIQAAHSGVLAGQAAADYAKAHKLDCPPSLLDAAKTREDDLNARILEAVEGENIYQLRAQLAETLIPLVAETRDKNALSGCAEKIQAIKERLGNAALSDRTSWANFDLVLTRRFTNGIELARLMVDEMS